MNKVFLGGTCNKTTWRQYVIDRIKIPYFNPVVSDWTPACIEIENSEKQICNLHLYVITKEMTGVYSIAEAVQDSNRNPYSTILCVLYDGFDEGMRRSLKAVEQLVLSNGAIVFHSLDQAIDQINMYA